MIKRLIRKIFKIGNTDFSSRISAASISHTLEAEKRHKEILNSLSTVFAELRLLNTKISTVHGVQKQLLDNNNNNNNKESDILTRRERLALGYALIRPTLGSINYPSDRPHGKMTKQNHKDIAKECVLYADKMIEASETPADDCG